MSQLLKAVLISLAIAMASSSVAAQETTQINVNTADEVTLAQLPGIGEVKARAIVMDRKNNGSYQTADDLARVDGIGEGTIDNLREQITF
ncbi:MULTISPECIES: ComEA family DNA-binding protein [Halomonadaceae]|uniref:Helix-hairpin-helix DNA-binding motif class 1 domain-containing protein n=1 Tax=Modicisalibacter zincidurans TaxID=1178777 RepID=A0ABP9QYZ0_9GAMM|nr:MULTISPECIES: ComEA family DNA-binding protein [Halomonas]MCD6007701.1 ComEA family DNA-binding protein [Halomonas sp. IOP_31]MEA3250112.1 ComEA family DNA-binding protein [Pseudomonadota bacterium]